MTDKLPGMVIDLEAKIDRLERGLAKAQRANSTAATNMERRARQSADSIGKSYGGAADRIAASFSKIAAGAGRAAPAIAAVGAAAAAAVGTLAKVAAGIAETGDAARRAGVGFEDFQRLKFLAEQNRIGVDALTDGLKELQLRADEFILTGSGSGAEAFQRLGLNAAELKRRLADPTDLFLEITKRLEGLDRAAQIRIADEVFGGTGGEQFVQLLAQGEDSLRGTMQRASDLGLVLDQSVLTRAEEIDRKFNEITGRLSNMGKVIAIEIADGIVDALDGERVGAAITSLEQRLRLLGDFDFNAPTEDTAIELESLAVDYDAAAVAARELAKTIDATAFELGAAGYVDAALELEQMARGLESSAAAFRAGQTDAETFKTELEATTTEAGNVVTALGEIDGVDLSGIVSKIGDVIGALAQAAAQAATTRAAIADATADPAPLPIGPQNGRKPKVTIVSDLAPTSSPRPQLPSVDHNFGVPDPVKSTGGGGGGGDSKKASDYDREVEKLREVTVELELESLALAAVVAGHRDLEGAIDGAEQKAKLLAAALRSGREDSPALRAEIDSQVAAWGAAAGAADKARDRLEAVDEARQRLSDIGEGAFTGLVTGALTFKDALGQVLGQLAQMAASRLWQSFMSGTLTATTPGGGAATGLLGLFGKVLGFADGGWTGHGGRYEPAGIVHRGEFVMSAPAVRQIGVPALEALHEGAMKGYSSGGLVGAAAPVISKTGQTAPQINIAAPVTVNGSGGTPEQNADLANRMARELESAMKAVVASEIRTAMRPGGTLNRR